MVCVWQMVESCRAMISYWLLSELWTPFPTVVQCKVHKHTSEDCSEWARVHTMSKYVSTVKNILSAVERGNLLGRISVYFNLNSKRRQMHAANVQKVVGLLLFLLSIMRRYLYINIIYSDGMMISTKSWAQETSIGVHRSLPKLLPIEWSILSKNWEKKNKNCITASWLRCMMLCTLFWAILCLELL